MLSYVYTWDIGGKLLIGCILCLVYKNKTLRLGSCSPP